MLVFDSLYESKKDEGKAVRSQIDTWTPPPQSTSLPVPMLKQGVVIVLQGDHPPSRGVSLGDDGISVTDADNFMLEKFNS